MTMKRITAILCAAVMIVGLAGCGAQKGAANSAQGSAAGAETSVSQKEQAASGDAIRIATKPMTEQFILSEMLKLIIEENTDYKVEITKGIGGGTNNIQPAMEKGEFDLYPEYT